MRALLTGASSFTGFWFASALRAAGFAVVAPLRREAAKYEGVRGERARKLAAVATIVPDCTFGSASFLDLVCRESFDVFCHHAARVTDYRSMSFDIVGALAENTNNLQSILEMMLANGLKAAVLTGSVFEANEGSGSWPMRAFSPYGVSKGLTSEVFRYWSLHLGIPFAKFVIPNPFGPFEEARFCAYLMKTWRAGETAEVRTPVYLRDNIHVDLLALAYADYVKQAAQGLIEEPGSRLGRYLVRNWERVSLVDGESLVYWLRKLIFRGAWLDHQVKRGALEVVWDDEEAEFAYQHPGGGGRPLLELAPVPSWHELQYRN